MPSCLVWRNQSYFFHPVLDWQAWKMHFSPPWTNFFFDLLICKVSREPWNIKGALFHPSAILNQHFSWLAPPGYIKLHDNYPIIIIIRHFRNFFPGTKQVGWKATAITDCLTGNKTILRFSQASVASIKLTIMQRIGLKWHKDSRGWVGKIMKKKNHLLCDFLAG